MHGLGPERLVLFVSFISNVFLPNSSAVAIEKIQNLARRALNGAPVRGRPRGLRLTVWAMGGAAGTGVVAGTLGH